MTAKIQASADGTYGSLAVGNQEAFRFGADNSGQLAGFRNRLINGGMRVWQRGNSIAVPNSTSVYTSDRWEAYGVGAAFSVSRFSAPDSREWLQVNGASGLTVGGTNQIIEAANIRGAVGSKLTLSFLAGPTGGSFNCEVSLNGPATKDTRPYSTLLAPAQSALINGYKTYSFTFELTAEMSKGCMVSIYFDNLGAGSHIDITNVQLEEGSIATPFEQRPIGLELSLCQRYYEVGSLSIGGYLAVASTDALRGWAKCSVTKRAVPTIELVTPATDANNIQTGSVTASVATTDGFRFYCGTPAAGTGYITQQWKASAEL